MCIEATPSGQGPLVHAHLPRYYVARSSSSSGVGALGRGAKSSFRLAVQYIRSMIACWANQEFMSDNVNLFACDWVSPSAPCVSEPGPPKRPPTRRLLLPRTGLAHGTFDVPVTSGSGKSAAASRDGPPPSSDGRSWPSVHPGRCPTRALSRLSTLALICSFSPFAPPWSRPTPFPPSSLVSYS